MTATAKSYGPAKGGSYAVRAATRWNGKQPDWVTVLAKAADAAPSQGELAHRLGCSASAISGVIGKTYAGKYAVLEALVRGALMSATVECPVLAVISRNECAQNQRQPFSAANPQRAQLYRACRAGCPHAIGGNNAQR